MAFIPISSNLGRVPKLSNGRHILSGNKQIYIKDGVKHRQNGPAEIHPNGYRAWFWKGVKHRRGGPAVIHPDGTSEYWENGKFLKKEKAPRNEI